MTVYQVEREYRRDGEYGLEHLTDPIDTFVNLKDAEACVNKFQVPEGYCEKHGLDPDEVGTLIIRPLDIQEHFNPEEYDCVLYDFFWLDSYQEKLMKGIEEERDRRF